MSGRRELEVCGRGGGRPLISMAAIPFSRLREGGPRRSLGSRGFLGSLGSLGETAGKGLSNPGGGRPFA